MLFEAFQYILGGGKNISSEVRKTMKLASWNPQALRARSIECAALHRIYNKALESGLARDLTRLEVTLELDDFDSVRKYFEGLRILRHGQMAMSELGEGLTQNDKVVLDLLNLHPEYLERMNWAARKKFKPYLVDFVQPFVLGLKPFNHVAGWTAWFITLNIGGIFGDAG